MKKLLLILLSIITITFVPHAARATADEPNPCYALIGDDAIFYSLSDSTFKPLFVLPSGYFVRLTGETDGDYLVANYLDLTGYVLSYAVEKVDYVPRYKYAETNSLTITGDGHPVNIRSAPDHTSINVLTEIPDETTTYFYGTITGSAQVPALGDLWYYVRTSPNGTRGYVYSLYADAKPVAANVIEREPGEPTDPTAEEVTTSDGYTAREEAIIVISLCVPAIVVMYLLFCAPRSRRDERK